VRRVSGIGTNGVRNELLLVLERAGYAEVVVEGDHNDRPATSEDDFVVFVATKAGR
jgi:hypothetical protein